MIHFHTKQKQAEQNIHMYTHEIQQRGKKKMNKYVIQNYNVYSSLSHMVGIQRRRNKNGIVFLASWHTDDLENLQHYKFNQLFFCRNKIRVVHLKGEEKSNIVGMMHHQVHFNQMIAFYGWVQITLWNIYIYNYYL